MALNRNNNHNDVRTNGFSDIEKFFVTLMIAVTIPLSIGIVVGMSVHMALGQTIITQLTMALTTLPLLVWSLVGGFIRNGERERAVGGLLGQFTGWALPTGISWWFPPPIGQRLQPRSIEVVTIDRTRRNGKTFAEVQTRDGGQVEVQANLSWQVVDPTRAARYSQQELGERANGIFDRQIRFFALYFDSDAGKPEARLSNQKVSFSCYVIGDGESRDLKGRVISNDVKERVGELGIRFNACEVFDVNPPQEVIDARHAQASEIAQAIQEERDIDSLRKRILELMWGTSNSHEIQEKKRNGHRPLMSADHATRAARAARGDLIDLHVSGEGGDFTKGAAIQTQTPRGDKK